MKRQYEKQLNEFLTYFPCVAILGARQCGKTTLLSTLPSIWNIFDLEKASDFDQINSDPDLFLRIHSDNIAIDEAQLCPAVFSALRVAIDQKRNVPGRFIVTGSSSPDLTKAISESLAGRVGIIEISPFTYKESLQIDSTDFYEKVLNSSKVKPNDFLELTPTSSINQVMEYWLKGGYPEPWIKNDPRFRKLWMENYIKTYLERDIKKLFPGLDENRFRLFLQMLSNLSGKIINYSETARALGVSQPTIRDYYNIAHGTFIWRNLFSFEKNTTKRIVKHPKGYYRDNGLINYLLRIPDQNSLLSHPQIGTLWESVVIEEIIRNLNCLSASFDSYYYRTSAGAEVDLVLDGEFGLLPIEIKHSQKISKSVLRGIKDFLAEQHCPFGLVINNDEKPRLYTDNLIGVPFNYL